MNHHYPRVLIIHMSCVYERDQRGLLIRSMFSNWPRSHLAQIYSGTDNYGDGTTFCKYTFKLGPSERRLGKVFFRLKRSSVGQSSRSISTAKKNQSTTYSRKSVSTFKRGIGRLLLNTGFWEAIFAPRLSEKLVQWVIEFSPEVIYCSGFSLGFCWLPIMLKERLGVPIVFHTPDDWPNALYRYSPMHIEVLRTTKKLLRQASARIAFSAKMANAYQKQFRLPFDIVMNCDNLERFERSTPKRVTQKDIISIVYTGALGHKRWESLIDLCDGVDILSREGIPIKIFAFVSHLSTDAAKLLEKRSNLIIAPPVAHDDLPSYLKGADILFLPESFDPKVVKDIRYSISTKAHLYMMSKRPILVYGAATAGVVDYARQEGWAYVVDQRSQQALADALRELIYDQKLQSQLINTGVETFFNHHDKRNVHRHFLSVLHEAILGIGRAEK